MLIDQHHPIMRGLFYAWVAWLIFVACFVIQTIYISVIDFRAGQFLKAQKHWDKRICHVENAVFGHASLEEGIR